MFSRSVYLTILVTAFFIFSGCTTQVGSIVNTNSNTNIDNTNVNGAIIENTNSDQVIGDEVLSDSMWENQSNIFYYAENAPNLTSVYAVNVATKNKELAFQFENNIEDPRGYSEYSVSFSPQDNSFVYSDRYNLYLYDLDSDKSQALITSQENDQVVIDEIHGRLWSNDGISTSVFSLQHPYLSPDGSQLYFAGGLYEGINNYIYSMSTGDVSEFSIKGEGFGGVEKTWSSNNSIIGAGSEVGYVQPGLFIGMPSQYSNASSVLPDLEEPYQTGKIIQSKALFIDDSTLLIALGDYDQSTYSVKKTSIKKLSLSDKKQIEVFSVNSAVELEALFENYLLYAETEERRDNVGVLYIYDLVNHQKISSLPLDFIQDIQDGVETDETFVIVTNNHQREGNAKMSIYSFPDFQEIYSDTGTENVSKLFLGFTEDI